MDYEHYHVKEPGRNVFSTKLKKHEFYPGLECGIAHIYSIAAINVPGSQTSA